MATHSLLDSDSFGLGLIDIKKERRKVGRRESMPVVDYSKINLEIAV